MVNGKPYARHSAEDITREQKLHGLEQMTLEKVFRKCFCDNLLWTSTFLLAVLKVDDLLCPGMSGKLYIHDLNIVVLVSLHQITWMQCSNIKINPNQRITNHLRFCGHTGCRINYTVREGSLMDRICGPAFPFSSACSRNGLANRILRQQLEWSVTSFLLQQCSGLRAEPGLVPSVQKGQY